MFNNPFIPPMKADTVIVAGNSDTKIIDYLRNFKLNIIPTIKCMEVDDSVAYHPDIVIHPVNYDTLVIAPNVYDYYKEALSGTNLKLIKGEKKLEVKYPDDIAYNVGRMYGIAIHNFKHTDEVLKYYLSKEGLEFVNINQGYTKCSMAIVDEQSVITADKPIYDVLKEKGYSVLLIESGFIKLENQKYGFIGGATGNYSNKDVFLSGTLDEHPDTERIIEFIKSKNKSIHYLSNNNIVDIGTIISLNCN
ncbi:MAG: hypothetical protein RIN55_06035 [Tissierellaceae bacterium]|nr:hypothetical protein [Tissierellaceae bacterium]